MGLPPMTGPIETVLCATDLSPAGDVAIRQADALAKLYGAKLEVFHALPDLAHSSPLFPHPAQRENTALVGLGRKGVAAVAEAVGRPTAGNGEGGALQVGAGTADAAIVEEAQRVSADLIVVGGAGPSPRVRAVLGAVAE